MRLHLIFSLLVFVLISGTFSTDLNAQLLGNYNFDNCDFTDANGTFPDATTIFPPSCDCGLNADGLYFDGSDDHMIFPAEIDSLMEEDFSISFYFQFDQVTTLTDIISVRSNCDLDSFMALTYDPSDQTLSFELAQTIGDIQSENVTLDFSRCWHRVVITKSDLFYFSGRLFWVYLKGVSQLFGIVIITLTEAILTILLLS